MNDRELQEKAAKAAGITVEWSDSWNCLQRDARPVAPGYSEWVLWRPLSDDGDALQLANRLQLDISHNVDKVEVTNQWEKEEDFRWAWESYGDNRDAAVRRAIVCTAAALSI